MNNLKLLNKRLNYEGGAQEGRMIRDKYRGFSKALLYSYQAAEVRKLGEEEIRKCLINPDKNSQNYDDKTLSIDYAFGYKTGDIFDWLGTDTKWLIYLRELTEDAYFRASIRRCKYQIKWIDQETNTETSIWCYVRGPVETKIDSAKTTNFVLDMPNWTLEIYMPANEQTINKFKRYDKFIFNKKAWEVQAVDDISMEGVLQIIALENYVNDTLDNLDEELDNYYKVLPVVPETGTEEGIAGMTFIKPGMRIEYSAAVPGGEWSVLETGYPVTLSRVGDNVLIEWTAMTSGQFTLQYRVNDILFKKVIIVESLF